MAIKINNLNSKNNTGRTYIDLRLDLEEIEKDIKAGQTSNTVPGNDISVDYDTTALRNSITNIMTTNEGERPLALGFGLNLYKFIGDPVTDITGRAIAREIERGIAIWEPRVNLKKIYIIPNPDQLMFEIIIVMEPIFLKDETILLTGNLSQEKGFRFVEGPIINLESVSREI